MGWQDQGRQFHQWFGHGTAGVDQTGPDGHGPEAVAKTVALGAATLMRQPLRRAFERYLGRGGMEELQEAIPIWARSAGLDAAAFRKLLVGTALWAATAGHLQEVGRLVAAAATGDAVVAASQSLATALTGEPADTWHYGLNWARDQSTYAEENGLLPPAPNADRDKPTPTVSGQAAAVGAAVAEAADSAGPLVDVGRAALGLLTVAEAALAAGAVILLWPKTLGDGTFRNAPPGPGVPPPLQARKPKPSGGPERGRIGTHERPPAGSKPISQTPWSGDHDDIKGDVVLPGTGNVQVAPNGHIWAEESDARGQMRVQHQTTLEAGRRPAEPAGSGSSRNDRCRRAECQLSLQI